MYKRNQMEKIEISEIKVDNILKQAEFIARISAKKVEDHIDDKKDLQQL